MGWELRKGKQYYYAATWEDGRCVKRYCGSGFSGKAAAQRANARADRRTAQTIDFMKFAERIKEGETLFADARRQADNLLEAVLLADGCYQASHTWRRRRTNHERSYNRES